MDTSMRLKTRRDFCCNFCDYRCCKLSDMEKHLSTDKHKKNTKEYNWNTKEYKIVTENSPNSPKLADDDNPHHYVCLCGKKYKYHSGLWKHKKTCNNLMNNDTITDNKFIKNILQENNELKNMILEVCKNGIIYTNNSNTTNIHNKTFNLNVFLNEECKDAMNIMEFVDSLQIQLSDLETVGKVGFVEGITNIIIKNLKALDVNKRPVHCSDSKREIMYVKDENKWEKENDEKIKLRKAIKYIAYKNTKIINEFKAKYPDCIYSTSNYSDQYNKLIIEAMGGKGNNDLEKENKIIKNIAKEVIIKKNIV